jgi:hypothetical protein
VRAIVIHENSKRFRKQRVREDLRAAVPEQAGEADDSLAERTALRHALDRLGPRQRAVIVLRFWLDMSEAGWDYVRGTTTSVKPAGDALLVRPVLFFAPRDGTTAYGDASLVNVATMKPFDTLTTHQYNNYYAGYQHGNEDDAVLDSTAIVINGDVQSAPETSGAIVTGQLEISGPQPVGFTEAQAKALAAQL